MASPSTNIEQYNLLGQLVPSGDTSAILPDTSPVTTQYMSLQDLLDTNPLGNFRRIGQGCCGTVWTPEHLPIALKRADGASTRYLWKEYYCQTRALEAMNRMGSANAPTVCIPRCYWYTNASDDAWWSTILPLFPAQTLGCNTMCSDLIPSLPEDMISRLIERYCPSDLQHEIKTRDTSRHCIARLYLGRHREGRPSRFFSLRNYGLSLDQAEQLQLPVETYAQTMGETLAMLHWEANLDANDVEFVLGSSQPTRQARLMSSGAIAALPYNARTRAETRVTRLKRSGHKTGGGTGELAVWLLDFDCCGPMSMDDAGIETAASAFYRNDPYFPRPGGQLWSTFSQAYIRAGESILQKNRGDVTLPTRWVARLCQMQEDPAERSKDKAVKCGDPFFL